MKLLFGTRNKNKVKEAKAIFNNILPDIEIVSLDEIDPLKKIKEPIEDGDTFYMNSLIKARYYYEHTNLPTICDDSGIVVEALGGRPGVYSARFSLGSKHELPNIDKSNNIMLLDMMKNEKNRLAYYECEMVYYDGIKTISGNGKLFGRVLDHEEGSEGFGYDPLFFIDEYQMTLGKLDANTKNRISHRYQAILNLGKKLSKELK